MNYTVLFPFFSGKIILSENIYYIVHGIFFSMNIYCGFLFANFLVVLVKKKGNNLFWVVSI